MEENESSMINMENISNSIERFEEDTSDVQPVPVVQVEETEGQMNISRCLSASIDCQDDMHMNEMSNKDIISDDDQSRLSFVMKEKLHALTSNIRCRTSQVNKIKSLKHLINRDNCCNKCN